tara:strand:- start:389 stop:1186 length:798 start_codon:yes stop_codon:yes gene_type:complete
MALTFTFHAVDGSFNKQFKDMLEVEKYFGPSLRHGYVSPDGVQRISPANEEAEEALRAYRTAATYDEIKFYDDTLPMPVHESERADLVDALKKNVSVSLGDGKFVMRGSANISLALSALCEGEVHIRHEPISRCREDCVVQTDDRNGLVFITDLRGEASSVGELAGRKMQDVTGGYLLLNRVYDDESGRGSQSIHSVIVGPAENVRKAFDDFYATAPEPDELISFEPVYSHQSLYPNVELQTVESDVTPESPEDDEVRRRNDMPF